MSVRMACPKCGKKGVNQRIGASPYFEPYYACRYCQWEVMAPGSWSGVDELIDLHLLAAQNRSHPDAPELSPRQEALVEAAWQ